MIDIHSHLIPGVDDGAKTLQTSVSVLERFAADGVELLVCTPHLNASEVGRVSDDVYVERFAQLLRARHPPPELRRGWEIMLDEPGANIADPSFTLGGSTAALVEFPRSGVPTGATAELARIRASGVVPVVAHPERYWGCTTDVVREWRRVGAATQIDATMLVGSGPISDLARDLLAEGLVDCIASDNHGDSRALATARDWLEEIGAGEQARLLTRTNAGRLLSNEPVVPVAPVPRSLGVWARLREVVKRRRPSGGSELS